MAILADDLSGALDAAAAFARPRAPIEVIWGGPSRSTRGGFAIDSETRDLPPEDARAKLIELLPQLLERDISYKKINSLLRGNTATEIATCAASGRFGSVVVAPAFPAQNRITRNGIQHVLTGNEWLALQPSLIDRLKGGPFRTRLFYRGERPDGGGVLVCDAESEADLATIAASAPGLNSPVLWCGSAGLARSLGKAPNSVALPEASKVLAVTTSRHPISRVQLKRLAAEFPQSVTEAKSVASIQSAIGAVAAALSRQGRMALAFSLPAMDAGAAARCFRAALNDLVRTIPQPGLLIVSGGDTLMFLSGALEATRLESIGEWRPGMGLSVFPDGSWRGTAVLSKSGAFGDERLLIDALAPPKALLS